MSSPLFGQSKRQVLDSLESELNSLKNYQLTKVASMKSNILLKNNELRNLNEQIEEAGKTVLLSKNEMANFQAKNAELELLLAEKLKQAKLLLSYDEILHYIFVEYYKKLEQL